MLLRVPRQTPSLLHAFRYNVRNVRTTALASPPPTFSLSEEDVVLSLNDRMREGVDMTFEPIYRVVLHYTQWSDNNFIAVKLKQGVPVVNFSHALRTVENAASYGSAIIVTVPKDEADLYEMRLNRIGLKVSVDLA